MNLNLEAFIALSFKACEPATRHAIIFHENGNRHQRMRGEPIDVNMPVSVH